MHEGLDFSQGYSDYDDVYEHSFGIFSIKFSKDGREIVAGTNDDSIYVYDLLANKVSLRLPAHSVSTLSFLIIIYFYFFTKQKRMDNSSILLLFFD